MAEKTDPFSNPNPWDDPKVQAALDEGRQPEDICLIHCPSCGIAGYYNQGSYFSCGHCGASYYCCSEGEDPPIDGRRFIYLGDEYTLLDYSRCWLEEEMEI